MSISLPQELIEYSNNWTPPVPSKNAPTYHYHFQCWNCLAQHDGVMQSDTEVLEIECKELVTDPLIDPLWASIERYRVCGKVNHCLGRRIKIKSKTNKK